MLDLARSAARLPVFLSLTIGAMIAIRLCFLGTPAGRDEAGFLMVGNAWGDGDSLYGPYWVDRPPLLLWIMDLAGTLTNLRLIGLLACVAMVLGVARAAYLVRGPQGARWAAATAALFSTAHWFGVTRTNGEMLCAGFVAWGFALTIQAFLPHARRPWLPALGAGVLAACSCLIKQSIVDGLVFAAVLAVAVAWQQPATRRRAAVVVAAGTVGFVVALATGVAAAAARGTSPAELFDALVTFRAEAGEVIRTSATAATGQRLIVLLATWAGSGLGFIAVLAAWCAARRREPVVLATFAVIAFASGTAVLGGSYWGHYLFQLVPASALAAGLLANQVSRRLRTALGVFTVAVLAANLTYTIVAPPHVGATAETVGTWLRESGNPSDTAVVVYGQPNVLGAAGMSSPYPYLWSLPVRTLDPDLTTLSGVLTGPDRPTWFVEWTGVDSWGITGADRLENELDDGYRKVAKVCGRTVWLARGEERSLAPVPKECP
ncbi:hypothetical protein GEV27_17485 [Aeromicrobium sp. S22]|uniref:hypothetical protein n=1 Tax=Aeromicrobium sp. S22 TaxID=2662029 RepID=UPI00129EC79C|nr:hypothetical protein [Aeromicrobium sp. S22]MRK03308.1 hypothetical protein [Aeromicrobium sp. S22]